MKKIKIENLVSNEKLCQKSSNKMQREDLPSTLLKLTNKSLFNNNEFEVYIRINLLLELVTIRTIISLLISSKRMKLSLTPLI